MIEMPSHPGHPLATRRWPPVRRPGSGSEVPSWDGRHATWGVMPTRGVFQDMSVFRFLWFSMDFVKLEGSKWFLVQSNILGAVTDKCDDTW